MFLYELAKEKEVAILRSVPWFSHLYSEKIYISVLWVTTPVLEVAEGIVHAATNDQDVAVPAQGRSVFYLLNLICLCDNVIGNANVGIVRVLPQNHALLEIL